MLFASRYMCDPDRGHSVLLLLSLLSYLSGGASFADLTATEDFCDPNPCANGGTCVRPMHKAARLLNPDGSPHSTYQCICPNGWGGPNCTEDLNDCIDQPCLNGGVCENQLNMRYVCHCGEDFVGQNCEYTNPCKANPCENGGSCQADVLGRFTCECPRWYQGERCELELDPCHRVNPCQGPQSKCHLVRDKQQQNTADGIGRLIDFRCECGPGYKGRYCEKHEDPCAHVNCTNGGRCFYLGNQTTCICPPGFSGSICELRQDTHQDTSNQQARIVNSKINLSPDVISGSDICEQAGCALMNAQAGDRICRADCVLKGCLGLEELKDCPYWQACLAASVTQSATSIQESCLGRFRNGHCDVECNVPECYYDGMDCVGSRPTCVDKEFCTKHYGDGVCQPQCAESVCGFDGGDCLFSSTTPDERITPSSIPSSTVPPSIPPLVPPSLPAAFGEPLLFLAVLNTTTKEFDHERTSFLSTIGMMVRGVARIWRNNRTNSELLMDLPTSRDMKLVLAIWLCPAVQNLSECNNPLIRRTPRAVGDFIRSTVTLASAQQPMAMKSFAPLEDSGQLDFNYITDPQWSRFLKSKEAIAIYICLFILAGIIVILVIFLVLQRDPWHKPSKRVFTAGVWCPPVAVGLKQELRPVNRVSNCIGPTARDSGTSNKQHPSLLSSYVRDISGVELPDKCGSSFPAGQSAPTPESGISGDSFEKPTKMTENRLKRKFFEGEYLMPSELHAERMQPPSKSQCTNHKPLSANNYTSYAPRQKDSNGHGLVVKDEFLRPLLDPTSIPNHCPDSSLSMHNQLSEILRSQDGLHPLTVHEAGSIRELLQSDDGDLQRCAETSTFSHHFVPRIDNAPYDYNGTPRSNAKNTAKLLCLKTDGGSNCASQEPILHLAGRMNSGRDFVLSLQQNLKSDQLSQAVSMVDDTGRSALATAAAANAIETVGALYQLEKEVSAASRAQGAIKPHDSTPANTTKSRRRQKQLEPRQTTALIAAVRAGNDEVVRCLIDEGCPLTGVDEFGRNAIHWAAATNSISLLQRLVQCKGFYRLVNARDDLDRTPLMLATREGFEQAVQFLLEHKAGVLVADCTENDPIAIARMKGFKSIENLLLKYHNPETCNTGLTERCLQDKYHGSPFDKVTESPSETSEFDTQSMGADSDEPEQPGGTSPTKQLPKEWHSMNIENATGFRCNSDSLNTPLGKSGQFVRLVNPRIDQSQLSIERNKHASNK